MKIYQILRALVVCSLAFVLFVAAGATFLNQGISLVEKLEAQEAAVACALYESPHGFVIDGEIYCSVTIVGTEYMKSLSELQAFDKGRGAGG